MWFYRPKFLVYYREATLAKQGVNPLVENLYHLFRGPDVQATPH
jgi:hypothetical protein